MSPQNTCFDPKNHRHSPDSVPVKQHRTTKINTAAQVYAIFSS